MTNVSLPNGRYDVVIVGARCSGAATAMLLARAGVRVLVVDRQAYGTDRLSTHALMRGAVLQLSRWGVLDRILRAGTPTVRDTTFHYGDEEIRLPIKSDIAGRRLWDTGTPPLGHAEWSSGLHTTVKIAPSAGRV